MARLLADIGEIGEATKSLREAMSLNRQLGNPDGIAETLYQTACLMSAAGKIDGALRFFQRALSIHEMTGNVRGQSTVCYELGYQLSLRGRKDEARPQLERAVRLSAMVGDARGQAVGLVRLAQMTFATDPVEAFVLLRDGERHLSRIGAGRDLLDALQSHRSVARSARNAAEFCFASANLVLVHLLRGDRTRAAENAIHLAQKLPIERSDLAHQLTAFALWLGGKAKRRDLVMEQVVTNASDLGLTLDELRELTPEVPELVQAEGELAWVETMLGEWLLATPEPLAAR